MCIWIVIIGDIFTDVDVDVIEKCVWCGCWREWEIYGYDGWCGSDWGVSVDGELRERHWGVDGWGDDELIGTWEVIIDCIGDEIISLFFDIVIIVGLES